MTRQEFMREVKNLGLNWRVSDPFTPEGDTNLRCMMGDCPIIALYKKKIGPPQQKTVRMNSQWSNASLELGLEQVVAQAIVRLADTNGRELLEEIANAT